VTLDAGVFLLQWAAGGLLFCWVTTRRREVGLGYGWLLRSVFGALAVGATVVLALRSHGTGAALAAAGAGATAAGATVALVVSALRRGGGTAAFPAALDLVAPAMGALGILAAADVSGGPYALTAARLLVGAAFLGAVTDAMLLGHWYLVQPGLRRDPLKELVVLAAVAWPFEVAVFLVPRGMVQVFTGVVDDGYGGLLGWVWIACAVTTIAMIGVTWAALRERYYSAVMSATGLLYLAILTAFGTDLVARAVLSP
jgi:hypothetical protein